MLWICLAFVGLALTLSLPLCLLMLRLSHRWQWLDPIGAEAHKKHERVVPNTGGVAIFWSLVLPIAAMLAAAWLVPEARWQQWAPAAAEHLAGLRAMTLPGAGLLAALAVMHFMGLVDDRRALGPGVKLGAQVLIALALVLVGQMRVLTYLDDQLGHLGVVLSAAITVAWIIVIVNAFNFLDNMDGLTGGVAAIIAALYLGATLYHQQWFVAGLAALLLGALLGFLGIHAPPARLFMGDAGSLVVGLALAVISIRTTYFAPAPGIAPGIAPGSDPVAAAVPGNWYGLLMPLIVMAVPLYDFISVTLIRLAQGRSPFRGDHSHFSHRLVDLGLSRRRAVGVIWLCTLATGLSGVMLGSLQSWQALLAAAQTLAVLAVLAVLERGAHRRGAAVNDE